MSEQDDQIIEDDPQIFNSVGLDLAIIRPDVKTNILYERIPKEVVEEVYETDSQGNLVPVIDQYGVVQKDNEGKPVYKVKGYQKVIDGTKIVKKMVAAPNFANTNRTTSNIRDFDIALLEMADRHDADLLIFQELLEPLGYNISRTLFRHNVLRTSIETLSKGRNQVTVQAIKTFITKQEGKKIQENIEHTVDSKSVLKNGGSLLDVAKMEMKK